MGEDDEDKRLLLHFSIILCLIASIGGVMAINPQFNDINANSDISLELNNQNMILALNMLNGINLQTLKTGNISQYEERNIDVNKYKLNTAKQELTDNNTHLEMVSASSTITWNLKDAQTVYLTSDRIMDEETDRKFLLRIKSNLQKAGINVIIDPRSSSPNQVPRAIKNAPKNSVVIIVNYNCAGTIKDLCEGISGPQTNGKTDKGYLYKYAKELNGVIYVNVSPQTILKNSSYLPRAYDDGFSPDSFEGLSDPAKYLLNNGIGLIDSSKSNKPVMGNEKADAVAYQIIGLLK